MRFDLAASEAKYQDSGFYQKNKPENDFVTLKKKTAKLPCSICTHHWMAVDIVRPYLSKDATSSTSWESFLTNHLAFSSAFLDRWAASERFPCFQLLYWKSCEHCLSLESVSNLRKLLKLNIHLILTKSYISYIHVVYFSVKHILYIILGIQSPVDLFIKPKSTQDTRVALLLLIHPL